MFASQCGVECGESSLAAFVVFECVNGGNPGFDRGVAEFLDDVEEVFVQLCGEFVDVLIDIQERGDEAAGFVWDGWKVGELL